VLDTHRRTDVGYTPRPPRSTLGTPIQARKRVRAPLAVDRTDSFAIKRNDVLTVALPTNPNVSGLRIARFRAHLSTGADHRESRSPTLAAAAIVTPFWSDGVLDEYAHHSLRATIETGVQAVVSASESGDRWWFVHQCPSEWFVQR
jgi:hypothetical protein